MAGSVANSGDLVRLNDERWKPREGARADASVLHVLTIKPLDEATILRAAASHMGRLVIVVNVSRQHATRFRPDSSLRCPGS